MGSPSHSPKFVESFTFLMGCPKWNDLSFFSRRASKLMLHSFAVISICFSPASKYPKGFRAGPGGKAAFCHGHGAGHLRFSAEPPREAARRKQSAAGCAGGARRPRCSGPRLPPSGWRTWGAAADEAARSGGLRQWPAGSGGPFR